MPTYTAVDLGATSGRVVNVFVDADRIALEPVRRFANEMVADDDGGRTWDFEAVLYEVVMGIGEAAARGPVASIGVDSWAVDYGLLDAGSHLVGPVHAYRSARTDGVMDAVGRRLGNGRLYGITGIQFLPFNTVYQLVAARETAAYRTARSLLLLPDLINNRLCGSTTSDITNASTTQLLDVRRRAWSAELLDDLRLRADLMPRLHEPGTLLGTVPEEVSVAAAGVRVVAVASHDTASAVAGTPLSASRPGIYISCGTWALVGCELPAPVTTDDARRANVTNELGVGGTTRLLKNVTGLWLLEECRRAWAAHGIETGTAGLVEAATREPIGLAVIDPDDPSLTGAADMPAAIAEACRASGQPVPASPAAFIRIILDSLALSFRRTVRTIERVSGVDAAVIHLVGGGSLNGLLARLCASACERPVLVGPAEATVVGNALVQAIADGAIPDLEAGRRLVETSLPVTWLEPQQLVDWDELGGRLGPG
jgi:rhamnulokinase